MEPDRDTVLKIYDAVADASLWPDLLQDIANQVDAVGCIVFEWQRRELERKLAVTVASSYYTLTDLGKYIARFFEEESRDQDLFEAHSLQSDQIELVQDDVLAPTIEDLRALSNVSTLEKLGIRHRAAGLLNKDNPSQFRFSVQLDASRGRLSADELGFMQIVLPHVAKAFHLGRPTSQLALEHRSLLAAMDRLIIGVCILDSKGNVVVENEEFRRQRSSYRVFYTDASGTLRLYKPGWEQRFEMLKSDVSNHGKFGARPRKEAIAAEEDVFLCIEVVPLHRSHEIGSKSFDGFIVYSSDTSQPIKCQTGLLQSAFGLSNTEISLAEAIAQGLTNRQIAERRERSVATINAQVKSILSKTNCATRTQFVRLMMGFGADYLKKANQ
ncbi:helix-turn-helix transcriptional regulator [Ruegeria jejuensis]|uniref:helix-turn-helix transcriptional regulator n=1 Tax=Ruegeria jejuensis TaxID=3233338 RepID=UPI00355C28DB